MAVNAPEGSKPIANKGFKDSVFTSLFSDKERLLELYNAIQGTSYRDASALVINTLPDVLFMNRRNDISFTIAGKLVVLFEHQSTINENMPLRILLYIARLYERIINAKAVYKQKLVMLPRPEFIVLYNGTADFPKEKTVRLSEAFERSDIDAPPALELTVRIFNINQGENAELEHNCAALAGYAVFVARTREGEARGLPLHEAVTQSVRYCLEHGILKEYLQENSSEVINMLLTEFNMEDALAVAREEGIETGIEKGREEGIERGIERGIEKGIEKGRDYILSLMRQGLSYEEIQQRVDCMRRVHTPAL